MSSSDFEWFVDKHMTLTMYAAFLQQGFADLMKTVSFGVPFDQPAHVKRTIMFVSLAVS